MLAQATKEEKKARKEMMTEMEGIQQAYAESGRLQEEMKNELARQEQLQQRLALEVRLKLLVQGWKDILTSNCFQCTSVFEVTPYQL